MEINKLGELYMKLTQKYSYQNFDKDNDGNITESEILSLAYQDEELRAELNESDLEMIKDVVSVNENSQTLAEANSNVLNNSAAINNLLSNMSTSDLQQLIVYLCSLLQTTTLSGTELLSKLQNGVKDEGAQYDNNNLINANYDCLKTVYQKYLENSGWVEEKRKNGDYSSFTSQQLDIDEKPIDIPLSTSYWNGQKEFDRWSNINLSKFIDIDGDGELTIKDLKLLPTELDFDNDGEISNEEKTFLEKLKVRLYMQVKNSIIRELNTNSLINIDDIISYLEIKENDGTISKAIKTADRYLASQGLSNSGKTITNENSYAWSAYGISAQSLQNSTTIEDRYLKVLNKSDLSKEQLTEILNRINSASSSVQTQLADVKAAIQKKLEAIG